MNEAGDPDRRTSGTGWLGVAITVGMVLLIVLGLFVFRVARSKRAWAAFAIQAPAFAERWTEDLRAGRLDEAYRVTTPTFKARLAREAFGRWVADHPELKSEAEPRGNTMSSVTTGISIGLDGIRFLEPHRRLTYRAGFGPAGKEPRVLTTVVVSEAGQLLVDQAEIEPEAPSNP